MKYKNLSDGITPVVMPKEESNEFILPPKVGEQKKRVGSVFSKNIETDKFKKAKKAFTRLEDYAKQDKAIPWFMQGINKMRDENRITENPEEEN